MATTPTMTRHFQPLPQMGTPRWQRTTAADTVDGVQVLQTPTAKPPLRCLVDTHMVSSAMLAATLAASHKVQQRSAVQMGKTVISTTSTEIL